MSSNPDRSRLAQVARVSRQAQAAMAAGRLPEAVALLKEAAQLDPRDRRTLHRLGDLHRIHLNRFPEAAGYYAVEARCEEREGFHARAIALWKLALRCEPGALEAHERIGALYVELGRVADARLHYEESARALMEAGLAADAAILRAHLATVEGPAGARVPDLPPPPVPAPGPAPAAPPPDDDAASEHLRVVTWLLRRQGEAETAAAASPWDLPPVEEWVPDEPEDLMEALREEIREDVERVIDVLERKGGGR